MDWNDTLICAAVGVKDRDEALRLVAQESAHADVIEIRLDFLADLNRADLSSFVSAASVPILYTLRPNWEGGFYTGNEQQRIELLGDACEAGAAYVDLELRAPQDSHTMLREKMRQTGAKLIISYHDFAGTPDNNGLEDLVHQMAERGADVGKVITTPEHHLDALRVLGLQATASQCGLPLIAFCMGESGMMSRVATTGLGGYMTYCAAASGSETASGQFTVAQLRSILAAMA